VKNTFCFLLFVQEGGAFQDAQVWKSHSDTVGSVPFFAFEGPAPDTCFNKKRHMMAP
jgi:hypothetical protein